VGNSGRLPREALAAGDARQKALKPRAHCNPRRDSQVSGQSEKRIVSRIVNNNRIQRIYNDRADRWNRT